mmetsp:Transcript_3630/g.11184  ORF Transcript_3630/g.11184 Transcript_3630/m.11184 type:complete len:343 (-) Transcript_3630:425-1453(-)
MRPLLARSGAARVPPAPRSSSNQRGGTAKPSVFLPTTTLSLPFVAATAAAAACSEVASDAALGSRTGSDRSATAAKAILRSRRSDLACSHTTRETLSEARFSDVSRLTTSPHSELLLCKSLSAYSVIASLSPATRRARMWNCRPQVSAKSYATPVARTRRALTTHGRAPSTSSSSTFRGGGGSSGCWSAVVLSPLPLPLLWSTTAASSTLLRSSCAGLGSTVTRTARAAAVVAFDEEAVVASALSERSTKGGRVSSSYRGAFRKTQAAEARDAPPKRNSSSSPSETTSSDAAVAGPRSRLPRTVHFRCLPPRETPPPTPRRPASRSKTWNSTLSASSLRPSS